MQRAFHSYSETMDICPCYMGTCHLSLMLHGAGKHMKTNNTPQSPQIAFLRVRSTKRKSRIWATLTFHTAFVRVAPSTQQPSARWTCKSVWGSTESTPGTTLAGYHFTFICLSTNSHNTFDQLLGLHNTSCCDLVKCENEHKQGNTNSGCCQEQAVIGTGRMWSQPTHWLCVRVMGQQYPLQVPSLPRLIPQRVHFSSQSIHVWNISKHSWLFTRANENPFFTWFLGLQEAVVM